MAWRLRLDFYTGRDLLHAEGDVYQLQPLTPLEPVLHDRRLDLRVQRLQVLVRLPGLDLQVT